MQADWINENSKLTKIFVFDDFKSALQFVNKVGEIAEKLNHHPDILMYDYKKVKVSTTTHKEEAVTNKDYELATEIDVLVSTTR